MLTRALLRAFRRDKQGVFWSFFFPVFFILIFGSIFSGRGKDSAPKFAVGVVALDKSPAGSWPPDAFKHVPVFDVKTGSEEKEKEELQKGNRRVVIVFPADFGEK